MYKNLLDEAKRAEVLSKKLISTLLEYMEYPNPSFLNWIIEILGILKSRVDRGDVIIDEVSLDIYTKESLKAFIKKHFSSYVYSQVYAKHTKKEEKAYFQLEACDDGYNLVIAPTSKEKTYRWISSLSERFSLVELIATGIVYIKDKKTNSYTPFISKNGKYCRYYEEVGRLIECKD